MSDHQYEAFLSGLEEQLPRWEAALKRIDPAKSNMSYALGEKTLKRRDLALRQVEWAHAYIQKERMHRRLSQEHALSLFMQGIFDTMEYILWTGPTVNVRLEDFAPAMGELIGRIKNDVTARIELLEKGSCP